MIVSSSFLASVVILALLVTMAAPIVLLVLWFKDFKKGQLW